MNHLNPLFHSIFERHFDLVNAQCAALPKPCLTAEKEERPSFRFETDAEPTSVELRRDREDSRDWEEDQ